MEKTFDRSKTIKYFKRCLDLLPNNYTNLLGVLETEIPKERRDKWVNWIYAQQILPDENNPGSPFSGLPFNPNGSRISKLPFDAANLAMTYTALACLLILGDDLSRVDRHAIINALKYLQKENGSGINVEKAVDYIRKSQSYDYGVGQGPGEESHGNSLYLLNRLDEGLLSKNQTIFWLLSRQTTGFQGRANKPPDTCYSFWIGASLKILDSFEFIDFKQNFDFLMETQTKYGGFSKWPEYPADVMHAYMGVAGLSLMKVPELQELDPALNISLSAKERLKTSVIFNNN
ncbi:10654_t:CDS:2 [Diversispora eburnea]|uniref:10654_t:CDS:1 n=1 Tax=Diversispora eburnea TaxID=1213867 RepID=A0A9N9C1D3_9GLOM|nr:10654_t:CDS:2 [Diversispora eburnea]